MEIDALINVVGAFKTPIELIRACLDSIFHEETLEGPVPDKIH